jgi:hypothetical protein
MPADCTAIELRNPRSITGNSLMLPSSTTRVVRTVEISFDGGAYQMLGSSDQVGGIQPIPSSRGGGELTGNSLVITGIPLATLRKLRVKLDVQNTAARCQYDLVFLAPADTLPYVTDFPLTENPISEGGRWLNGELDGVILGNVRTTPGKAFADRLIPVAGPNADSTAILVSPVVGPDQYVEITIHREVGYTPPDSHEIALILRGSMDSVGPIYTPFYQIQLLFGGTGCVFYTQDGTMGGYAELGGVTGPSFSALVTGDVIRAKIVDNVMTVYKNGVFGLTCTDDTFANGSPGIGFFVRDGCTPENFCISRVEFGVAT